jgi:hypothetical protein
VCTIWENSFFSQALPYHFLGRFGQHHRLDVFLTGVVVPLEDGKGLEAGNSHNSFVVPAFPYLFGDEGMPEVMKVQIFKPGRPT